MPGCPDDNDFAALLDGSLAPRDHAQAMRHIESCPSCRQQWMAMSGGTSIPALLSTALPPASGGFPEERHIPEVEPSLIGQTIARYVVRREIGRGSMGVVYEAVHPQIRQRAAVKVLSEDLSRDEDYMRRFLREARAACAVQHGGLVTIFDYGQLPSGSAYLMMEHLSGESLHARLAARGGRLPEREALRVIRQIASAMAAVHKHGIVHRDLKPANIMLVPDSESGDGERAKVVDFGLAKFSLSESMLRSSRTLSTSTITDNRAFVGTVAYASPEQCDLRTQVTDRSDVYSLGIMLYELLAGHIPFQGSLPEVMIQHVQRPPPPLQRAAPEASAAVCELVRHMLAKDPAQRPSMLAVRERIDEILARLATSPRRGWLVTAAVAVLIALGALALLLGTRQAPSVPAEVTPRR